jgi:hypothetical protein
VYQTLKSKQLETVAPEAAAKLLDAGDWVLIDGVGRRGAGAGAAGRSGLGGRVPVHFHAAPTGVDPHLTPCMNPHRNLQCGALTSMPRPRRKAPSTCPSTRSLRPSQAGLTPPRYALPGPQAGAMARHAVRPEAQQRSRVLPLAMAWGQHDASTHPSAPGHYAAGPEDHHVRLQRSGA